MTSFLDRLSIQLNNKSDKPIYLQIAKQLQQAILKAKLGDSEEDFQLPSVRNLSQHLQVAPGTIQQAYNYLEKGDYIYRVSGKGTFVQKNRNQEDTSRVDRALLAIDEMLDYLDELGFSNREKQIYFDLKMRDRDRGHAGLKIGIIDGSSEIRTVLQNALSGLSNIEIFRYPLDELSISGEVLVHDLHLIITSSASYERLTRICQDFSKQIPIVTLSLQCSMQTIINLARIENHSKIGLLTYSQTFGNLIYDVLAECMDFQEEPELACLDQVDLDDFFTRNDLIILPKKLIFYVNQEQEDISTYLRKYEAKIIDFEYTWQAGSFAYLQEKIDRVKRELKEKGLIVFA